MDSGLTFINNHLVTYPWPQSTTTSLVIPAPVSNHLVNSPSSLVPITPVYLCVIFIPNSEWAHRKLTVLRC